MNWWRVNCSATKEAHSPGRPNNVRGVSNSLTRAPSFSTKRVNCHPKHRPSCFASCKNRNSSGSVVPALSTLDVRVIAATNRNLTAEVDAGRFRSDLFYRLSVFPLTVPPLRQRRSDIPLLADHFLTRFSRKLGKQFDGIAPNFLSALMDYSWQG